MKIAIAKRRENIAEYILYLWQLEDLLRALKFDADQIYTTLVAPQDEDDQSKQDIFFWYVDIVNLLKSEGKIEIGHLDHTIHLIADLNDLHQQLLVSEVEISKGYKELFSQVKGELPKIKSMFKGADVSDIESCFRLLYSVVLLRLKGEDKNASYIDDVIALISPLVAYLADVYKRVEDGEVTLFKD